MADSLKYKGMNGYDIKEIQDMLKEISEVKGIK